MENEEMKKQKLIEWIQRNAQKIRWGRENKGVRGAHTHTVK